MQVKYRLPAIRPLIDHNPVALGSEPFLGGDLLGRQEQVSHYGRSCFVEIGRTRDMLPGNNEYVSRRHRLDIAKRHNRFVLIEPLGWQLTGGNPAEDAPVIHDFPLRHR